MFDTILLVIKEIKNNATYVHLFSVILILLSAWIFRKIVLKISTIVFKIIDKKVKPNLFENYLKPMQKIIGNFASLLVFYISIYIFSQEITVNLKNILVQILDILFILNTSWIFIKLSNLFVLYLENKAAKTESKLDDQLVPIVKTFLRVFILLVTILLILQNVGYSVSGILAGLGIGGIAVAFAAKDALSNIFGSLVIFLERPFQIGDTVILKGVEGTVEEVGLRSTRIRTFSKSLITIPNSEVSLAIIENTSCRQKRRVNYVLGLTYNTPSEKIAQVVDAIREILKNHPMVDQEMILVHFTGFGPSSLDILVYYFINTNVWADYLAINQEINLKVMQTLEKLSVSIAYPSTSIYIEKMPQNQ